MRASLCCPLKGEPCPELRLPGRRESSEVGNGLLEQDTRLRPVVNVAEIGPVGQIVDLSVKIELACFGTQIKGFRQAKVGIERSYPPTRIHTDLLSVNYCSVADRSVSKAACT